MDRTKLAIAAAIALVVVGVLVVVLTRTPGPKVTADAGRKLPIELGWNDAEAYLGRIGYPIVRGEAKLLVARDSFCATDAECRTRKPKIIFHYAHAGDTAGPYCVTVTHSYPLEWRSIVQKLTGEDAAALPPVDRDYVQVLRTGIKLTVSVDATKLGVGAGCL
ncbi:MAG: hypothetical protein ABI867_44915 [Kofleriaceae bacterium]